MLHGLNGSIRSLAGSEEFIALGPIPDGAILRRLLVTWAIEVTADVEFAASLCLHPEASLSAMNSGEWLIDAGIGSGAWRGPLLRMITFSDITARHEMLIHRRIVGGPRWAVLSFRPVISTEVTSAWSLEWEDSGLDFVPVVEAGSDGAV